MPAPAEADRQIGQRIARARRQANLSVRELAERLGWPHSNLTNYETGRRGLSVTNLIAIARALGLPPAALLIDPPEAIPLVQAISDDVERCLQVAYILQTLLDPEPRPPEET